MTDQSPVITIDGPSGSGKGTIARLVAKELGWHYLESGALYRILAFAAVQAQIRIDDVGPLVELVKHLPVKFENDANVVYWSNQDITAEIHTEHYGNLASQVAVIPEIREALLARQRIFATSPGLVTDGRDMGTVVFPEAVLKFFLIADRNERAKRRYRQLKEKRISVSLANVLDELTERDYRDQHRAISPLKSTTDSIVIDSTSLNVEQTFEQIMSSIREIFRTSTSVGDY